MTNADRETESMVARLLSWSGLSLGLVLVFVSVLLHVIVNLRHVEDAISMWCELASRVTAEIGAVMFAFALLHVTYDRYTRGKWMSGINQAVRDEGTFAGVGMKCVYRNLESVGFHGLLRSAKRFRILKTWFPESDGMRIDFAEAVKNASEIRILLCNPASKILSVRCLGAGESSESTAAEWVWRALQTFHGVCTMLPNGKQPSFEIGLYDEWPGCPVIYLGERIFLGFYFRGRPSPEGPWIEVWPGSYLAGIIDDQFKLLWGEEGRPNPKTIRIENCKDLHEFLAENGRTGGQT